MLVAMLKAYVVVGLLVGLATQGHAAAAVQKRIDKRGEDTGVWIDLVTYPWRLTAVLAALLFFNVILWPVMIAQLFEEERERDNDG